MPASPSPDSTRALPSRKPSQSQVKRKPELLGENHVFFGAFPHPVDLAALEMDNSSKEENVRQAERMFHAPRQRHRRFAASQRPVGMAEDSVTQGRQHVGEGASISSQGVCQRRVRTGIVEFDALLDMLERPREVALEEQ